MSTLRKTLSTWWVFPQRKDQLWLIPSFLLIPLLPMKGQRVREEVETNQEETERMREEDRLLARKIAWYKEYQLRFIEKMHKTLEKTTTSLLILAYVSPLLGNALMVPLLVTCVFM